MKGGGGSTSRRWSKSKGSASPKSLKKNERTDSGLVAYATMLVFFARPWFPEARYRMRSPSSYFL